MKIPITRPCFGQEEKKALIEPLETGWVVQGPKVAEFENLFARYSKSSFAVATTSCTTALHLALASNGIGPGDEVIVPAFTWVSTANVIEMQGARPVFVDIRLDTFNIDESQIEQALTPRTKVIMPVSLFGLSADMAPIFEIAQKHSLKVIEDDACAIGSWYKGHHAGTLAHAGCFSFHPRKAITTGEGGMVITSDEHLAERMRCLRDHGASVSDLTRHLGVHSYLLPDFNELGYNYRMTDLQGALGVAQMNRLEWILERRTARAHIYDNALTQIPWLRPPIVPENYKHGYQAYVCLFQPGPLAISNIRQFNEKRNELMDRLESAGVSTRPGTHAVHMLGLYRNKYSIRPEDFPNAYFADQLTLTLPLFAQMTDDEQECVVNMLMQAGEETQVMACVD